MTTPNSFVQVNNATTPGKKLATYEFLDGEDEENCLESEAVTLTDSEGNEVLGPKIMTEALPVVVALQASTLLSGKETPVTNVAVKVLSANPMREAGLVQNTGKGTADSVAFSQEETVAWPGEGPHAMPCEDQDDDCAH